MCLNAPTKRQHISQFVTTKVRTCLSIKILFLFLTDFSFAFVLFIDKMLSCLIFADSFDFPTLLFLLSVILQVQKTETYRVNLDSYETTQTKKFNTLLQSPACTHMKIQSPHTYKTGTQTHTLDFIMQLNNFIK